MDSNVTPGTAQAPAGPPSVPDLRTEVIGTVLLFALTVMVTAGVALCAHVLAQIFG